MGIKIGLVSCEFKNRDLGFNVSQIEKALKTVQGKADLLCFGEAFLQGFDALGWDYEEDRNIAVSMDSEVMRRICAMSLEYGTDLLFGYLEHCDRAIYSSCAVIGEGRFIHNYRRISKGWKEYRITDGHYREGADSAEFRYRGRWMKLALCGDLWDFPERFKTEHLLIWPVYVDFTREEWTQYEAEYAGQALLAADRALMINSISHKPESCGGAFFFHGGRTEKKSAQGTEDILILEME